MIHITSVKEVEVDKYIRREAVEKIVSLSGPTIYRLEKEGNFPQRRKIGKRAVAWLESEVSGWLSSREWSLNRGGK
jgi:prophage regulatory protein